MAGKPPATNYPDRALEVFLGSVVGGLGLGSIVVVPLSEALALTVPAVIPAIATVIPTGTTLATVSMTVIAARTALATISATVSAGTAVRLDITFRLRLESPH